MANRLSLLMKITTSERQWSEVKQKRTGHGGAPLKIESKVQTRVSE